MSTLLEIKIELDDEQFDIMTEALAKVKKDKINKARLRCADHSDWCSCDDCQLLKEECK